MKIIKVIVKTVDVCEFIKIIYKKIISIRKSIENWENRILAISGVNPGKCSNCSNIMRFYDIVYPKYESMRERVDSHFFYTHFSTAL